MRFEHHALNPATARLHKLRVHGPPMAWKAFFASNAPELRLAFCSARALTWRTRRPRGFQKFSRRYYRQNRRKRRRPRDLWNNHALDVADEIQVEPLQSLKASRCSHCLGISVPMLKMPTRVFFVKHFLGIHGAHYGKLCEIEPLHRYFAHQQNKFISSVNDRSMQPRSTPDRPTLNVAAAKSPLLPSEPKRRPFLREPVPPRADEAVAFLRSAVAGVVHFHDFAGVDDSHAMVAKTTGGSGAECSA